MHHVFLIAISVGDANSGSSAAFLELIFVNDVPFAVLEWDEVIAGQPRLAIQLDPHLLTPSKGKADFIYSGVIDDPRTASLVHVGSRAIN